ncbi:glycosyltransferase [Clostridium sp. NSJ-49]|uniref:glycosyltransferase n=1 Tax=Clostridium TaxID=1485 RepID=UPI00164A2E11|nr:glycosyltransferase [Clostridium sp. NSJ-49]MBC5624031.1 glycosyltransferase [Clostridium sp. NSJ-49]
MSKISIIVPIYNVELYVERCIESILNQSLSDFDLILVDDGSTDKSGEICEGYAKKDSRIQVIHKKNGGLSSARNAGIEIAQGKYIAFVDGDDFIHKDMYKILYDKIIQNDSDIVICEFKKVYNKTDVIDTIENTKSIELNNIDALHMLYSDKGAEFTVAWNKIYKKELFDEVRYEEGKIHEDEFIAHKLLYKAQKITYVSKQLYNYIQREDSIINSKFNIKKLDAVYAFNERKLFFKNIKNKELQYKAEYNYVKYFFENYYKAKRNIECIDEELYRLKKNFRESIYTLLKNPYFNYKEKLAWIVFIVNSKFYENYIMK